MKDTQRQSAARLSLLVARLSDLPALARRHARAVFARRLAKPAMGGAKKGALVGISAQRRAVQQTARDRLACAMADVGRLQIAQRLLGQRSCKSASSGAAVGSLLARSSLEISGPLKGASNCRGALKASL